MCRDMVALGVADRGQHGRESLAAFPIRQRRRKAQAARLAAQLGEVDAARRQIGRGGRADERRLRGQEHAQGNAAARPGLGIVLGGLRRWWRLALRCRRCAIAQAQPAARPCQGGALVVAEKDSGDQVEGVAGVAAGEVGPYAGAIAEQVDREAAAGLAGERADAPFRAVAFSGGQQLGGKGGHLAGEHRRYLAGGRAGLHGRSAAARVASLSARAKSPSCCAIAASASQEAGEPAQLVRGHRNLHQRRRRGCAPRAGGR